MTRMGRLTLLGLTLVIGLLLVLAACGGSEEKGPVKVGFIWPFTGFSADYGPRGEEGIRLRLEEADFEVDGRPIELIIADEDVLDASLTLERVKKLVEQDQVDMIIGPLFGSSQEAVGPYVNEAKVPAIQVHACSYALGEGGSFFCSPSSSESLSSGLGDYIYDELGYKSLTTLGPDYIYGHQLLGTASDAFEARGGEIVQKQWVPLGTVDMLPYATNLEEADAVLAWLVPADMVTFLNGYQDLGLDLPIVMIHGLFDDFMKDFGPTIQELAASTGDITGFVGWTWLVDHPTSAEFVKNFDARWGKKPTLDHVNAYVAADIAVEALNAADGDTSFEALREAILGLDLETPIGRTTFAASGMASSDRYVVKPVVLEDGRHTWQPIQTFTNVKDPRD
jgi:ABC-type branched-subunit amino acid transport system substrate-binding protein